MALLRNNKLRLLDSVITEITEGRPFIAWAESTAQVLVDKSSQIKNQVNIENILALRNIIVHDFVDSETSNIYKANLINKNNHYDLYLDLPKIKSDSEKKFILAHEIAHTLFYSDAADGLQKCISLSFGSKEIENICDYVAICLVLPHSFIRDEINDYKSLNNSLRVRNENYLKFIFHIALKYQVDWHKVLYRLICTFNFLPNSLCIEFIRKDKWYLRWSYQTDSLTDKKLYIPIKSKSENSYVSAKESFNKILNRISEETLLRPYTYGSLVIEKSVFDTHYQGNIKQFLKNNFVSDLKVLKIYYRVDAFDKVLMLFPFDGLLNN